MTVQARLTPKLDGKDVAVAIVAIVTSAIVAAASSRYGAVPLFIALMVALLTYSFTRPAVALVGVLAAYAVPMISKVATVGGIDIRFSAIPFMVALAVQGNYWSGGRRQESPAAWVRKRALFIFAGFAGASIAWSIDRPATTQATVALIMTGTLCSVVYRVVPVGVLLRVVALFGVAATAASTIAVLVAPGMAYGGERVRGIFENANGLAAFLVLSAPAVMIVARRSWWLFAVAILVLCASTGSRASTAAILLEMSLFLWMKPRSRTRRTVVLIVVASAVWLLVASFRSVKPFGSSVLLFRQDNSRQETWQRGIDYFRENFWLGAGIDAVDPGSIAGIGPSVLAAGGVIGALVVLAVVGPVVLCAMTGDTVYKCLILGASVNLVFEPWLITGGSLLCVVFWLCAGHPGWTARDPVGPRSVSNRT